MVLRKEIVKNGWGLYEPRIEYRYQVGSQLYMGSRYAPLHLMGSRIWAEHITRGYEAQDRIVVYVSPENMMKSYLSPHGSYLPYVTTLLGFMLIFVTGYGLRNGGIFTIPPPRPSLPGSFKWFEFESEQTPYVPALSQIFVSLIWMILIVLMLTHYLLFAWNTPHVYAMPFVLTGIALAFCLVPAMLGFYKLKVTNKVKQVKVWATRPSIHLSSPISARTEVLFPHKGEVLEVQLSLICVRYMGTGRHLLYENAFKVAQSLEVKAGEMISGSHRFEIPPTKQRPTTPFSRVDYPRVSWYWQVRTVFKNGMRCVWEFPIAATHREVPIQYKD